MIQTIVGPQTGTNAHQWTHKNMYVLPNAGDLTQLDCVDSSVNTWTYMTLMQRNGLFAFHRVAPLSYGPLRNTAVYGKPTAVISRSTRAWWTSGYRRR